MQGILCKCQLKLAQFKLWILLKTRGLKNDEGTDCNFNPPPQNLCKRQIRSIKAHSAPVFSQCLQNMDMCVYTYIYTYVYIWSVIPYYEINRKKMKMMFGKDSTLTCYFKMDQKYSVYINIKENVEQMENMEWRTWKREPLTPSTTACFTFVNK